MRTLVFIILALAGRQAPASPPEATPPAGEWRARTVLVTPVRYTPSTVTSDVLILVEGGDTVRARLRQPAGEAREPGRRHPLAILVVGLETGRDAVDLIDGHDDVVVFGMDYPFEGAFDPSGWGGIPAAFSLRGMAFATVRHLHIALDWLTRLPEVDTSDVTMVAVSFGVFTGVRAAAEDQRITRLAVVQGGGMIDLVIEENSERLGVPLPAWLSGKLGLGVLSPFEPTDHVGAIAPRPFILVSGESDRFFPKESVQSLWDAAGEPKEWVRHEGPHVMPDERALIRELTNVLARRLYGRE